jgi:hypothetical protein
MHICGTVRSGKGQAVRLQDPQESSGGEEAMRGSRGKEALVQVKAMGLCPMRAKVKRGHGKGTSDVDQSQASHKSRQRIRTLRS